MNPMSKALVSAGVKIPSVSERIWRIVKNSPKSNARWIASQLSEPKSIVSSLCSQLVTRGALYSEEVSMNISSSNRMFRRKILHFSVPHTMAFYDAVLPPVKVKIQAPSQVIEPVKSEMTLTFADRFMRNHGEVIVALQKAGLHHTVIENMTMSQFLQLTAKHDLGLKID